MTMALAKLINGFFEFKRNTYGPKRDLFERLAIRQQPKVMMVACSDSRVDPAMLTAADPGDVFTVRNVANLVPSFAVDDAKHGTSAAIEFAVTGLEVEHIIVCGHTHCGGIQALYTADPAVAKDHTFIHNWMQIADEPRRRTLVVARHRPLDEQIRICAEEAIKTSLANLLSFPWVAERVGAGRLGIHGWLFDIEDGEMDVFVPERDRFERLTTDLAARLTAPVIATGSEIQT